ncbi:MAG: hypothetical protein IT395_03255, partial [Candidatus Omnitrophica bacterium]|nr:hypothetical protein [Candidatus Omnitrophota bacterium]
MPSSRTLKIYLSVLGAAGVVFFLAMPGAFSRETTGKVIDNPYKNVYGVGLIEMPSAASIPAGNASPSALVSLPQEEKPAGRSFTPDGQPEMQTQYLRGLPEGAKEDPAKRTQDAKVFVRPDGQVQAIISAAPLHYQKDGQWKDIDTRWQPSTSPWDYQMVDNDYQAFVKKDFGEHKILRLEKNGHYLTAVPKDLSVQGKVIATPQAVTGEVTNKPFDIISGGGFIEWKNAYGPGLDFKYTPHSINFVKILRVDQRATLEKLIHRAVAPADQLSLSLHFSTDLDVFVDGKKWDGKKTVKTGHVEFKDKAGVIQWQWNDPIATDAKNKTIVGKFLIRPESVGFNVSVQFSLQQLQEASYPVEIDPVISYSATTDGQISGGDDAAYSTARTTAISVTADGSTMTL